MSGKEKEKTWVLDTATKDGAVEISEELKQKGAKSVCFRKLKPKESPFFGYRVYYILPEEADFSGLA